MATGDGAVNLGLPDNSGTAVTPFTLSAAGLLSAAIFGDIGLPDLALSGSLEGPIELPAFTLAATGASGAVVEADLFLPLLAASGVMLGGLTASGSIDLPALTLDASTGVRGALTLPAMTLSAAGVGGSVSKDAGQTALTLPDLTLDAAALSQVIATGDIDLDALTLSASGLTGTDTAGDVHLRPLSLAATGITGTAPAGDIELPLFALAGTTADGAVASGNIDLPAVTLAASAPAQPQDLTATADATLPLATLSATMLPGGLGVGTATLREPTLAATLANSPPMTGAITMAEFTLVATGLGSNAAQAVVSIPQATLSAQAVSGNVGAATVELPLLSVSAHDGVLNVVGTATITIPVFTATASAVQVLADPQFTGISLNTRTRAVSEYAGLAPNSITSFNGVTLMATADGILALAGSDDGGVPIEASFTTGKTNFNTSDMKRVLTAYIGYRADGDMELTLIADDHHEYIYTLTPRRVQDQQHASRSKFGRGVAGVYWQFKASNVDGSDFAIDRIEPQIASTGQKV